MMQNWSQLHPDRHISPLSLIKTHSSLIQPLLKERFQLPDKPHIICNMDKNPLQISLKPNSSPLQAWPRFESKPLEAKLLQHYKSLLAAYFPSLHIFTLEIHTYVTVNKKGKKKSVKYFRL